MTNQPVRTVLKHFGSYAQALRAAGLEPSGGGHQIETYELLKDWAAVARRLGKLPTMLEYDNDNSARYSSGPYQKRFRKWAEVAKAFERYASTYNCQEEWRDVLLMVEERRRRKEMDSAPELSGRKARRGPTGVRLLEGQPLYGPPVAPYGVAHEPANEAGVLLLFGMLAERLGFVITHVQTEFPDCEAYREVEPGKWQRWRIEVEYRSRNFVAHKHDPEGCELIVCWVHDWADCPLEVVELKSYCQNRRNARQAGTGCHKLMIEKPSCLDSRNA